MEHESILCVLFMFFEGNNPSRQEVHENSLQQNQIRKKHENERKSLFIKEKRK